MGVAIPIDGLPPLAQQLADWHDSVGRRGLHPASVAPLTTRQTARRQAKHRLREIPGKGLEQKIVAYLRGEQRVVHRDEIIGAMECYSINHIKGSLTELTQHGILMRPRRGHYVAP